MSKVYFVYLVILSIFNKLEVTIAVYACIKVAEVRVCKIAIG